jgi:hypothetical protein
MSSKANPRRPLDRLESGYRESDVDYVKNNLDLAIELLDATLNADGKSEPVVTVNGHTLSNAQAMTFRVALENFAMDLSANGLGDDAHGTAMTAGYLARINEIRRYIFGI